jgi:predicted enzyme related to lactoylglutathione lyase
MAFARLGVCALLILCCVHACSSTEDKNASAIMNEGGGSGGTAAGSGGSSGTSGAGGSAAGSGGSGGSTPVADGGAAIDAQTNDGATVDAGPPQSCAPREVTGTPETHFHHVHFNTVDPEQDLMFFEKFFGAPPVTFCSDEEGNALTRATRTERAWFLFTKVDEPPDPALNTYLEHIGWLHPMPAVELARMVELGVPLYPEVRNQCADAAMGIRPCPVSVIPDYYYYTQPPSGARVEVALGPGPATMGFGHLHFIMGEDLTFFETVAGSPFVQTALDMVNHINAALTEDMLANETVTETRGKPIDHIAYSTTDLEAAKARIEAAGIAIAEDISMKPEYGFRSFFVKSPKGTWVEMVEDSRFQ